MQPNKLKQDPNSLLTLIPNFTGGWFSVVWCMMLPELTLDFQDLAFPIGFLLLSAS